MLASLSDVLRNRIQPGGPSDVYWGLFTIILSAAVALGYCVIAFKWFFQFKLSERAAARAALGRLRMIVASCFVLGVLFVAFNLTRFQWMWRLYDAVLLLLVGYAWMFAVRMRGLVLVDERLAQLAELEQSVQRYRDLAELLPHIIWTATEQGKVDYSNRRWAQYAGEGKSWLDAIHQTEAAHVRSAWQEAVRGRVPFEREVRLGGEGQLRSFVVSAVPVVHGEAVRWLGACADIEEQKRLATEQEMQAKQKAFFLNALSHDLRAPLNNIALHAHLLRRPDRDPQEMEVVKTIGENVAAAGQLLNTLLEYASAGHEPNVVERVSVTAVLHQIRRRFLPLASNRGLDLRVAPHEEIAFHTDRHKLERILSNLVDNAVKYTQRGRVELSAGFAEERIAVRVTDTGGGVPRESAPFLFDEFFQVDNQGRDRSKGFGLGLAICKSLARQLGGDVRLVRTGPEGSCFELTVRDERSARAGLNADRERSSLRRGPSPMLPEQWAGADGARL